MNYLTKGIAVAAMSAFMVACGGDDDDPAPSPTPSPEPSEAKIRIFHGSPDAPAVDVSIDGSVALEGVDYYQSSEAMTVESGTYSVQIDGLLPADETVTVIGPVDLTFEEDMRYEILAVNAVADIEPVVLSRPYEFNTMMARVTVLHGAHSAPMVDVYVTAPDADLANATPLGTFSFTEVLGPVEVAAADYQIRVTPTGTTTVVYDSGVVSLAAGDDMFISALVNTNDAGGEKSPIVLSVAAADAAASIVYSADDGSDLRVVHNSGGAPAVDVVANDDFDMPLVTNLSYSEFTGYLNVPADEYNVKVAPTGTETAVIDADLTLDNGAVYTVMAVDVVAEIEPLVLVDDTRKVATEARVRVIHGSTLAGAVDIYVTEPGADITDLTPALSNVEFLADSGYIGLGEGSYDVTVTATGMKEAAIGPVEIAIDTGEIYTIVARDNEAVDGVGLILMDGFAQ